MTKTVRRDEFSRNVVLRLRRQLLSGTGCLALACGPASELEHDQEESVAVQTSPMQNREYGIIDQAPDDIRHIMKSAVDAADLFNSVKTGIEVANLLGQIFGLVGSPPPDDLEVLKAKLDDIAEDLNWYMYELEANTVRGEIDSAFTAARQAALLGQLLPRADGHDEDSASFLNIAGGEPGESPEPLYFLRGFSPPHTNGSWQNILRDTTPQKYGPNGSYVFDWRYSLPWYMRLIAKRLSVMAAVDPMFMNNGSFAVELAYDIREPLMYVRSKMLEGIRCDQRDRFQFVTHRAQRYLRTDLACADVNTGVFASGSIVIPDYGSCSRTNTGGWLWYDAACVAALPGRATVWDALDTQYRAVRNAMPMFEIDAMIDTLAHYLDPAPDLTESFGRIALHANSNLCLDVMQGNPASGTAVQLWDCNGTGAQQFSYDRFTKTIKNTAFNKCLRVRPFSDTMILGQASKVDAIPEIYDCQSPVPTNQQWTYDPQSRVIKSALGTVLGVAGGWLQAGIRIIMWDPDGTPSQAWRADRTSEYCNDRCLPSCQLSCAGAGPGTGACVGGCMAGCMGSCMGS
jgi:hypothetical protein